MLTNAHCVKLKIFMRHVTVGLKTKATGKCTITYPAIVQKELEKVALDGSVECCAPPPRWCDLEL